MDRGKEERKRGGEQRRAEESRGVKEMGKVRRRGR